jgi:nicotinamide phosphoribosyltransferase
MFEKLNKNPILWTDGYKLCHKDQYPEGTEFVYQTWTPRMSRIQGINHVCFFGLQGALAELQQSFDEHFFKQRQKDVLTDYTDAIANVFWSTNREFAIKHSVTHIAQLHKLGYLPIKIKALPEGAFVPIGCPMFTIENTHPDFFWLPGYLETQLSSYIWQSMTAATIADYYKRICMKYAELSGDVSKVPFQCGDFSMRGMGSPEGAYRVAAGHLTSFEVSATISTREWLKTFYNASDDVMRYTPATEHSVMCSYGKDEVEAFRHLITNVYPSGNISIVSDSYDLWNVVDNVLPQLKDEIMKRDGKLLIRPDSGDPVDIICGTTLEKGIVQRLFEVFGGTPNEKGYIELHPTIGVIYGDSITTDRATRICQGLIANGFASTNVNFGVGSYSYQFQTRDTFGFALKGTAEVVNGEFKMIFKDPKTDKDNFKKSQKGCVAVLWNPDQNDWNYIDGLDLDDIEKLDMNGDNHLHDFFIDGKFIYTNDFYAIRKRVAEESERIYNK